MQNQYLNLTKIFLFLLIAVFSIQLTNPIQSNGQTSGESIYGDKPKSYKKDDTNLCASGADRYAENFCVYYRGYMASETTNLKLAADYRNKMLYVLKRELDDYYDRYKVGREKKTKLFQTILDILGIGLAFSGTVVNGERAKTVIGATTGSFLAGRDSINERFKLLQTKILTNKMDANRLEKWAEIVEWMKKDINEFPWDSARDQLQQYAIRGTFENALNSLVDETGAEVTAANDKLAILGKVKEGEIEAKLQSFNKYISPMQAKLDKLFVDIERVTGEIALLEDGSEEKIAKVEELAALNEQKESLRKNYETIWTEILASDNFPTIQDTILNRPGLSENAKQQFRTFISNVRTKQPVTFTKDVNEYDRYLSRVNGIVSTAPDKTMNEDFLKILEANKIQ